MEETTLPDPEGPASTPLSPSPEERFCNAFTQSGIIAIYVNGHTQMRVPPGHADRELAQWLAKEAADLAVAIGHTTIRGHEIALRAIAERVRISANEAVTFAVVVPAIGGDNLSKSLRRLVRKGLRRGYGVERKPSPLPGPTPISAPLNTSAEPGSNKS